MKQDLYEVRDRTNSEYFVNSEEKQEKEKSFMHRVKLLNKHIYISKKNRNRKECEKERKR